MDCYYIIESLSQYVEGSLSLQAEKEVKEHIDNCEECQKAYRTLLLTGNFLREEHACDGSIDERVLNTIDRNKYSAGNDKYKLYARAYRLKSILKPLTAVVVICLILVLSIFNRSYIGNVFNVGSTKTPVESISPFNVLIFGYDINKHTDVMILANYNPVNEQISLLSIPRDTRVSINGSDEKIGMVCAKYGAAMAVNTVSSLINANIKYHIYVDTACVEKMIDLLDGIEFDIPNDMHYDDPGQNLNIHLYKGKQVLSGKQVVDFMRFRKLNMKSRLIKNYYAGSDLRRVEAQQDIIKAIIEQKLSTRYIIRLDELARTSINGMETNIPLSKSLELLRNVSKVKPGNINMFILPGTIEQKTLFYYVMDKEKTDTIVSQYFQSN